MTSPPRVLVLGAGSIGARHARLLVRAGATVVVTDPDNARAEAIDGVTALPMTAAANERYDAAVIASPTSAHAAQAEQMLHYCARVFVEKPLAATLADAERLATSSNDRLMVGYNLRCHAPVERLVSLVQEGRIGAIRTVRVWFGSYLPDWRPTADYREIYSAKADLGGGVLNDAIHELDLLIWLLGPTLDVTAAVVDRIGPLEIDVEDTVVALLRRADGAIAEVSLDYLSRRYRRGIEVVGDDATVRLDWARGVIEIEDDAAVTVEDATTAVESSYERQTDRFLRWVDGTGKPPVDAVVGCQSVRLAEQIRACAK